MTNEIVVKVEITLTVTPNLEKAIMELARAIVAHDREAADAEMARITAAAKTSGVTGQATR